MEVTFYATLRQAVGQKTVRVDLNEGSTVHDLLDAMLRQYPALQQVMFDATGHLFPHIHIFVNGKDLINQMDFGSILQARDTIVILPAVEGG